MDLSLSLDALATVLLILGIVAILVFHTLHRAIRMLQGVRARPRILLVYVGFYLFVAVIFVGGVAVPSSSNLDPVEFGFGLASAALLIAGTIWSVRHSTRDMTFEQRAGGAWYVRSRALTLPVMYVVLVLTEIALEFGVAGELLVGEAPATESAVAFWALLVADLLFAAVTGLLMGRNIAIYRKVRQLKRQLGPGTQTPP